MVLKTLLDCEIEFCFYNSFALMSFLLMISRPQCLTKNPKNQHYTISLKQKRRRPKSTSTFRFGRGTRTRTQIDGFGDRCSTAELFPQMATRMGLEPTTSAVTGRHSNQLNHRAIRHLSVCLTVIYITIKVLAWQVFFAKNFTKS